MAQSKKRLDLLLLDRGLAESRSKAAALILAGQVSVHLESGQEVSRILKAGDCFPENVQIVIKEPMPFVSRAGEKLAGALDHWNISVQDQICLDVGASTGGFCDCLLSRGAKFVYAVDVGHGQLHPKLRQHAQILSLEKTHILKWTPLWQKSPAQYRPPTFVTIDVSFISVINILPTLYAMLPEGGQVLTLIKPQFEVGAKNLKKGIVKNSQVRLESINRVLEFLQELGAENIENTASILPGAMGNLEEWTFFQKPLYLKK